MLVFSKSILETEHGSLFWQDKYFIDHVMPQAPCVCHLNFLFIHSFCFYTDACLYVTTTCLQRPEEEFEFPGDEVTNGCELSNVGAGK